MSSRYVDIRDNISGLVDEAARVGLKINAKKFKYTRINTRNNQRIVVKGEQVDEVGEFVYLDALLYKEREATKDTRQRLSETRKAFLRMRGTSEIDRKTKVNLFKTIVRSALMYGCEAWKLTITEAKKLDAFQYKCVKRTLRTRCPQTISHHQIQEITEMIRRWNWIGRYMMRKGREEHCVTARTTKTNTDENGRGRQANSWVAVMGNCQSSRNKLV